MIRRHKNEYFKTHESMKKTIWHKVLKVVIAVATAILGALGVNAMNP